MAFGTNNKSGGNNLKAFAFKILIKDRPAPEFEVKQRGADGKFTVLKTDAPVTTVRGNLIGLEVKSFDYQGDPIRSVNVTLQDGEEIDFVTIPTNFVGRSIMNSLTNLQAFENVSISLYNSKPKAGTDKVYASASLRQNDELVKWKYSLTDLPAPDSVIFKGKKQSDYSKQDSFLLNEIAALGEKIKNSPHTPVQPNPKAAPPAEKHEDGSSNDEPPF